MEFDKNKIYTAANADELRAGDKVIAAHQLGNLKYQVSQKDYYVKQDYNVWTIKEIKEDTYSDRFVTANGAFSLAYLVERVENCTNCGEGKWDAEHKKILCDPVHCGNGNVVFRNQEVEVCEYWKPKTKKKAEKHYRPFKDTEELVRVWKQKWSEKTNGQKWHDCKLNMPLIWVRKKDCGSELLITGYNKPDGEVFIVDAIDLTQLFDNFTFLDGSPCGVEE